MLAYTYHKRSNLDRLERVDNCLKVIVVKGDPQKIESLYGKLKSAKGVKHASFGICTTGKGIV
ncbi:MAG: hypothetical protein PHW46_02665 [Candidatus Omnitrophica bacterium]|nr:hypothetical protein [Candidatus Omnitrophota bacterium]